MIRRLPELRYFVFTAALFVCVILLSILSRWLFYILNLDLFNTTSWHIATAIIAGIRFDVSALLYLNSLIIVLWLIPLKIRNNQIYRNTVKWLFISINAIALFSNCADIVYYRFTLKRTTSDIFSFLNVGGDFEKLLPLFLKDFWYIALIWILMILGLLKTYNILEKKILIKKDLYSNSSYIIQSLLLVFTLSLTVIGMRGGWQLRPINIITASRYADGNVNSVVLNTPFTILQTLGKQELKTIEYFNEKELSSIYSPYHNSLTNNRIPITLCNKKNIVILIVESLSMEHVGFYNNEKDQHKGFTPFIDKIAAKGLVFQGISNGKKSIEGIPAIISGIPTLMPTPYTNSPYSGNTQNALPSILKQFGYHTAFFHGGTNGTMGFDSYCKSAGFDTYYGKREYHNDTDEDGSWGIWDEPFLNFFATKLSTFKQPFLATVFTLSSHHPFKIPEKYAHKFPKGKLPIQETIAYADFSIREFFATATKMSWYNNTLFVITADHTSESIAPEFSTDYGSFRIPIIFYDPTVDLSKYSDMKPAQQIDIFPTILSYLNIPGPQFCFGNNLLDTTSNRTAINYKQPCYQVIDSDFILQFDSEKAISLYNTQSDNTLTQNLINNPLYHGIESRLTQKAKAFIQSYNYALIYNKMSAKKTVHTKQ